MSKRTRAEADLPDPESLRAKSAMFLFLRRQQRLRAALSMQQLLLNILTMLLCVVKAAEVVILRAEEPVRIAKIERFWEHTVTRRDDEHFRRDFRLSRPVFDRVVHIIAPLPSMATHPGRKAVPIDKKLAIFLYFVSSKGVTYRKLATLFDVSESTAHAAVNDVIDALSSTPVVKEFITDRWPKTLQEFEDAALLVARNGCYTFANCIGAVDVTHIKEVPRSLSVHEKLPFIDRKSVVSTGIQAVVNGNLEFTHLAPMNPGSYHDQTILNSTLMREAGKLFRPGFYVLADSGYTPTKYIVSPFNGKGKPGWAPSPSEKKINYAISSTRMIVERAFGVLKSRFRVLLDTPDCWDFIKTAKLFIACAVLHNICRLMGDALPVDASETLAELPELQRKFLITCKTRALVESLTSLAYRGDVSTAEVLAERPWLTAVPKPAEWKTLTPEAFRHRMVWNVALLQKKQKAGVAVTSLTGTAAAGAAAEAAFDLAYYDVGK